MTGYSLDAPTEPSLFKIANIEDDIHSVIGDIRDFTALKKAFDEAQPEIVLHLAAQPIVRDSYTMPAYTYETNVMGTVNILECVRLSDCVKSFLNVTTDKVYLNREWAWRQWGTTYIARCLTRRYQSTRAKIFRWTSLVLKLT